MLCYIMTCTGLFSGEAWETNFCVLVTCIISPLGQLSELGTQYFSGRCGGYLVSALDSRLRGLGLRLGEVNMLFSQPKHFALIVPVPLSSGVWMSAGKLSGKPDEILGVTSVTWLDLYGCYFYPRLLRQKPSGPLTGQYDFSTSIHVSFMLINNISWLGGISASPAA